MFNVGLAWLAAAKKRKAMKAGPDSTSSEGGKPPDLAISKSACKKRKERRMQAVAKKRNSESEKLAQTASELLEKEKELAELKRQVQKAKQELMHSMTFKLVSSLDDLEPMNTADFAAVIGDAFSCECDFERIEGHLKFVLYQSAVGSHEWVAVGACTTTAPTKEWTPEELLANFGITKAFQGIGTTRIFLECILKDARFGIIITWREGFLISTANCGRIAGGLREDCRRIAGILAGELREF